MKKFTASELSTTNNNDVLDNGTLVFDPSTGLRLHDGSTTGGIEVGAVGFAGSQGDHGFTGSQGDPGFTGSQGLVWQGAWNPAGSYTMNQDIVSYDGGTYIKIGGDGNSGSAPPFDGVRWATVAANGSIGYTGSSGIVDGRLSIPSSIDFIYGGYPYMGIALENSGDTLNFKTNISSSDYTANVLSIDRTTGVVTLNGGTSHITSTANSIAIYPDASENTGFYADNLNPGNEYAEMFSAGGLWFYSDTDGSAHEWSMRSDGSTYIPGSIYTTNSNQDVGTSLTPFSTGFFVNVDAQAINGKSGGSVDITSGPWTYTFRNDGALQIQGGIIANGTIGTAGQVLTSNGNKAYWSSVVGGSGYTGSAGSQGTIGYSGSLGYTGSSGTQGTTGYTGSNGSQGTTGYTGSIGSLGYTGSLGFTGSQGTIDTTQNYTFSGNLTFSGTSDTFNSNITFNGSTYTYNGNLVVGIGGTDLLKIGASQEGFTTYNTVTGYYTVDCANGNIFNITPSGGFTPKFNNFACDNNYATSLTLVINQGGTAYVPTSNVNLGSGNVSVSWQGGTPPTGNINKKDIVTYSVLNVSGTYVVLGQLVTFG